MKCLFFEEIFWVPHPDGHHPLSLPRPPPSLWFSCGLPLSQFLCLCLSLSCPVSPWLPLSATPSGTYQRTSSACSPQPGLPSLAVSVGPRSRVGAPPATHSPLTGLWGRPLCSTLPPPSSHQIPHWCSKRAHNMPRGPQPESGSAKSDPGCLTQFPHFLINLLYLQLG